MSSAAANRQPIRIGLLGAGTWALNGHVRVLQLLPEYELVAVYARRREAAEKAAQDYGFRHVAPTPEELVDHPEVDLVVVASITPQHAANVRAALLAGKNVYCEWPLTTTTALAQELLELAQQQGARHLVGLQRRLAPHNRYLHDLLSQGFLGQLRSVRLHVSIPLLGARRGQAASWLLPAENFSDIVSIYAGHFLDMLFAATGWPTDISAIQLNQFPTVTIAETGEQVPATSLDQLVLLGHLGDNGVVSAQVEGGKCHGSGVQIDLTGTEGDLRLTNRSAFGQAGDDYVLEGAKADDPALAVLPVPAAYDWLPASDLPSAVVELGQLYAAYARDVSEGTHTAPTFADALHLHQFFDAIALSTTSGERVAL